MCVAGIERRDVAQLAAARCPELLTVAQRDFFERGKGIAAITQSAFNEGQRRDLQQTLGQIAAEQRANQAKRAELVRQFAQAQLAALGYRVLQAADGEQALRILQGGATVDLLFTDVVMPGMSGRELAQRALAQRPGLPVLYTSGYTEDTMVHHGRLDADVHLLAKPYRRDELARAIRAMLAR